MMGHILRFDNRYDQIKAAVDEGTVGKPLVCYVRRNAPVQEARYFIKSLLHVCIDPANEF